MCLHGPIDAQLEWFHNAYCLNQSLFNFGYISLGYSSENIDIKFVKDNQR